MATPTTPPTNPVVRPQYYQNWDFRNKLVDESVLGTAGESQGGNFISSESILIAAGPPKFSTVLSNIVPIGVIQNFNLVQNKNIQQLFEIGSRETILLPGRTFIQSSISRLVFDGPSLLRALYTLAIDPSLLDRTAIPDDSPLQDVSNWHADEAGNGKLYISLASEMFNRPMGIALLMHDNNNDVYGGAYLEHTYAATHNLSLSSGQTVVAESVSLRVSKVRPIRFTIPTV